MNIVFKNKGVLSLLDLTTMGESSKRDDSSKIGKYDSGLKYALSILYRNGIKVEIYSGVSKFSFTSKAIKDDLTNKVKELLVINEIRNSKEITQEEKCKICADIYYNGTVNSGPHNLCEGCHCEEIDEEFNNHKSDAQEFTHITAFSPSLGHEWKVWMAIRELYSNCIDESGDVLFNQIIKPDSFSQDETVIVVYDNGTLGSIVEKWDNFFLPILEPIYTNGRVSIFKNNSGSLKLYKNRILIFADKNVKSKYIYDYKEASIDEMRLLNAKEEFTSEITKCICQCNDPIFIQEFISHSDEDHFESKLDYWYNFSSEFIQIVNETYNLCTKNYTVFSPFPSLYKRFIEIPDIEIGVKQVKYNSPSCYWLDTKVEIVKQNLAAVEGSFQETFELKIKRICKENRFVVNYPIIESKIGGFTCISDVNKKILYVSDKFSKDTLWELVKAQFRIESDDDPDYCFKQYVNLLWTK